jgi:glycosyltransferase involved in cell wall biosynthesis
MKINILYTFHAHPWGGGNQFLSALRKEFIRTDIYTDKISEADVILFNSFPFEEEKYFKEVYLAKKHGPNKILIHRVDGPISSYRGSDAFIDKIISVFNRRFVDGTIYQSKWSLAENKKLFGMKTPFETVINNASDGSIFNNNGNKKKPAEKLNIVSTSWSQNIRKGFDIYKYLDKNLDFSSYNMVFVGRSPVSFMNIKHIPPKDSKSLADIMRNSDIYIAARNSDIYIAASKNDPCSNALIEALACGLPVVARNSGGHAELVGDAGVMFEGEKDILSAIEKVSKEYGSYAAAIKSNTIADCAQKYIEFAKHIIDDKENGRYGPKRITALSAFTYAYIRIKVITANVRTAILRKLEILSFRKSIECFHDTAMKNSNNMDRKQ